jgi:hypothetical protein
MSAWDLLTLLPTSPTTGSVLVAAGLLCAWSSTERGRVAALIGDAPEITAAEAAKYVGFPCVVIRGVVACEQPGEIHGAGTIPVVAWRHVLVRKFLNWGAMN